MAVGFEDFRRMALGLPEVRESVSYGTPSFKLKDKFLARFHDDGVSLVLKIDFETRDFLMQAYPQTYYITDHYRNYPSVLVRMSEADPDELASLLLQTWLSVAPKKLRQAVAKNPKN